MNFIRNFLSPAKEPIAPQINQSSLEMLSQLPVAMQSRIIGQIRKAHTQNTDASTANDASADELTPLAATEQTTVPDITPDRNVRRRLNFTPSTIERLDGKLSKRKESGIFIIYGDELINYYLSTKSSPKIDVVVKELSTGPHPYYKFNAMQLLYTVLEMTGAPDAVISTVNKEREPKVPHTADNKNMPADDVIGFLTKNGVNLCKIPTKEYEVLLGMDHQKPIIIEYIATKHKFEADDVDYHWTIFCILFRKEQLLLPFNDTSAGLILGSQFMEQRWNERHNFEYFCKNNLHNKISPVVDRKTRENRSIRSKVTRKLVFNNAWTIVTPIKSEDMIL